MQIVIDGETRSIDTSGVQTLGELVDLLEKNYISRSRVITKIVINEEELDEGQEIGLGAFPVKDISTIAISTADTVSLANEALSESLEYLPTLATVLEESSKTIREGNVQQGLQAISEALEVVAAFGEILDGIRGTFQIDFSKIKVDDATFLDKLTELGNLAKSILAAARENDWTLLADLVEYELAPLLYEWMAIIPELVAVLPVAESVSGDEEP